MALLMPLLLPRILIALVALLMLAACSYLAAFRWCVNPPNLIQMRLYGPEHRF